tara:strand:- start:4159 stop:4875 length:717 start_codon:yes stop_codon:yes gene_type:complete
VSASESDEDGGEWVHPLLPAAQGFEDSSVVTDREFDPIPRDEFEGWLTPREAMSALGYPAVTGLKAFLRELETGRVRAAAEDIRWWRGGESGQESYGLIDPRFWTVDPPTASSDLWPFGQHKFVIHQNSYGLQSTIRITMFDVRFEPRSTPKTKQNLSLPPTEPDDLSAASKRDLPKTDAERFSKAIIAGWPDATEPFAHQKAVLFFPDNKVPRDWFLSIFRLIRGPKSRGRQPKIRD